MRRNPDICRMKVASISEIKQELKALPAPEVLDICLRLARAKKENKELMTFLLFEAHNPDEYIRQLKKLIDDEFALVNLHNYYILKKNLRKILRVVGKHLKFIASKEAEVEVLMHFCRTMILFNTPYRKNNAIAGIYFGQIKKIGTAISALHEDLQHDYSRQLDELR